MAFHRNIRRAALAGAAFLALSAGSGLRAETVGPVTDELGVIKIPAGQPITIGFYGAMSGPDTNQGIDEQRGIEIAIKEAGGIAGAPVDLLVEDAQCTAEGGQTAASKLSTNPKLVLVIGPSCSSTARVGAPIFWNLGIVDVGTTASAPSLTDPNRSAGFNGFVRLIANDKASGILAAQFSKEKLGATKAATIHDGSAYAQQLADAFADSFTKAGGTIVAREAVSPTDTDMRPLLARLSSNPPEVIFMPIFAAAGAFILRQRDEIPALKKAVAIGGGGMQGANAIDAAGQSIVGVDLVTFSSDLFSSHYKPFITKYQAEYGEGPNSGFSAYGYDGFLVAKKAIEAVVKKDDAGNLYIGRKALRDAVFATKDVDGLTGTITCGPSGDCGALSAAIFQYTSGDSSTFEMGKNPKKIYP